MSAYTQAQWLLWIEYLQAKADQNEVEAAQKLNELLIKDKHPQMQI